MAFSTERRSKRGASGVGGTGSTFRASSGAEADLRTSRRMEAIGRLAGGAAREIDDMMCVIDACARLLLKEGAGGPRARALVSELQAARLRTATIAQELLAFSREEGVQPVPATVHHILLPMQMRLRHLLGREIELHCSCDLSAGRVRVDRRTMEGIILSLALHARGAMPAGGRLTFETRAITLEGPLSQGGALVPPGEYVALVVADTGFGLDGSGVLEPFFTVRGSRQPGDLAAVYGAVKHASGHIVVNSQPGRGTTFTVYLPRL